MAVRSILRRRSRVSDERRSDIVDPLSSFRRMLRRLTRCLSGTGYGFGCGGRLAQRRALLQISQKQIRIGAVDPLHDVGHEPPPSSDALAYLGYEHLAALASQCARRILVARWQWWRDSQVVANEQRNSFRRDREIALDSPKLPADAVKAPHERCIAALITLRIKKTVECGIYDRRLVASRAAGCQREPLGNLVGKID